MEYIICLNSNNKDDLSKDDQNSSWKNFCKTQLINKNQRQEDDETRQQRIQQSQGTARCNKVKLQIIYRFTTSIYRFTMLKVHKPLVK